jgi:O-antigen/teichoic acid export membrane protein
MKQFADHVQARKPLVRPALLYSLAVGAPVVLGVGLLALVAHPFFRLVFGQRWEGAADYAVILAAWAAVRLASLPIATLTTVLRVQRLSFYIDALFAGRVAVIPLMAALQMGPHMAVAAFCALSIIYHLAIVSVGLSAALRYDRQLPAPTRQNTLDIAQQGESYG